MSNPALLHLPLRTGLDGRDRNGIVTATAVGPVRFTADGYFAEEGTTNLVANPSTEVDTSNIFPGTGDAGQISRETGFGYSGNACMKVTAPGLAAGEGVIYRSLTGLGTTSTRTFVGSLYARGSGVVDVWTRAQYADVSITEGEKTFVTLTNNWQRIVAPAVTTDPAKTLHFLQVMCRTRSVAAVEFWVDAAQIEEKSYATSYADGSMGTGYSWAATAHNSASTRAGTVLRVPTTDHIAVASGAMAARVRRAYAGQSFPQFFGAGLTSGSSDELLVYGLKATDELVTEQRFAGVNNTLTGTGHTVPVGTQRLIYAHWSGRDKAHGLLDGTVVSDTTPQTVDPTGSWGTHQFVNIGSGPLGNHTDGYISDLLIFDRPLTDAERATLAATPEWSFGVLQPKLGGLLRLGMGLGLAVSSVAAVDPVAILRSGLGGSD